MMMDHLTLDPYERQLLTVFDSYDHENVGSLDRDGLTQLCQTLQLEEQGADLIKCLLKDPKHNRATFTEFKDALLALLGKMQNNKSKDEVLKTSDGSPDREVSPKFVYGSKKYGRRSRPKNEEINQSFDDEQNDLNFLNIPNATTATVQRSNSQIEVSNSKKRKTNYKLKRCTSLPSNNSSSDFISNTTNINSNEEEFICTEEMLREAWKNLGVGKDGYLNQTELVLVCDAIGLHKLADGVIRQLSNKLNLDYDHKISFQELLEALQQDDTWSEVLTTTTTNNDEMLTNNAAVKEIFPDSQTFQYITLGPNGNGLINIDMIIEMWENVGITQPKDLLNELGFNNCQEININELAKVLDKEIKGLQQNDLVINNLYENSNIILLNANLILYQLEIRCLKNIIEQIYAERDKLKNDVIEANNRAILLAQEVDDNHINIERNTINQVKLLEQRHNDIIKTIQKQYTNDKEQLNQINQKLNEKILLLEQEITKLKNDLLLTKNYTINLENDNQLLIENLNDLKQLKSILNEQIDNLENDKQKLKNEMENKQIEPLLKKLNELQIENSQLRDHNDEMVNEIENLNKEIRKKSIINNNSDNPITNSVYNTLDQSMEQDDVINDLHTIPSNDIDDDNDDVDEVDDNNISLISEGVGLGAKRRSNYSPTKDKNLFEVDGSPRLGKLRKFRKTINKDNLLEIPYTSNESGFDTEIDCCDDLSLNNSINDCEEIKRLQSKIIFLEQLLKQHSIQIPTNIVNNNNNNNSSLETKSSENIITKLKERANELEKIIKYVNKEITKMITKNGISCDNLHNINEKLLKLLNNKDNDNNENTTMINNDDGDDKKILIDANIETDYEFQIKKYEEENKELLQKCNELENCVELLKTEYERCEDYWQTKLDDERQMFEQEQNQNSDKLNDLINKMAEYEEQFNNQNDDDIDNNRLPTIDETFNLEKQFTDLEQEFDDYKQYSETELYKKDEEIIQLRQQLNELKLTTTNTLTKNDVGIQIDDHDSKLRNNNDKMNNLSLCLVEKTDLYSNDSISGGVGGGGNNSSNDDSQELSIDNGINKDNSDNSSLLWNSTTTTKSQPSTSSTCSTLEKNNTTPCRPKRTRKHERNNLLYKKSLSSSNHQLTNDKEQIIMDKTNDEIHWRNTSLKDNQKIVALPITTIHNLNGRLHHLEQRCRQLQMVLKQQHFYTEQTLQQTWQHHQGEKAELQCYLRSQQEKLEHQIRVCNEQLERLTRSDMLVKELYVENSYLIAKVQRLEQQCHMLVQCTSNCSSV